MWKLGLGSGPSWMRFWLKSQRVYFVWCDLTLIRYWFSRNEIWNTTQQKIFGGMFEKILSSLWNSNWFHTAAFVCEDHQAAACLAGHQGHFSTRKPSPPAPDCPGQVRWGRVRSGQVGFYCCSFSWEWDAMVTIILWKVRLLSTQALLLINFYLFFIAKTSFR